MQGSLQIFLIFSVSLLLRWSVTYHPYSGQGNPPMFGDYEAQRHWQEITLNIPIEKWYINSTDNNLQYWGLDYPPLTAYHSLLLGHIADKINSSYVKLHESKGITTAEHKFFMRLTVLFADVLIYIPAMIWFISSEHVLKPSNKEKSNIFGFKKRDIVLLVALIYPGLILIDHCHFQYNCVSLGLFIGATTAILKDSFIFGSFLFVAALNYKQMELYHALPMFFYILGRHTTVRTKSWLLRFGMLFFVSVTVVVAFVITWLPFLKNWETFVSVVFRLFPFARGVFEDKVANVWCAVNVVYKLRNTFSNEQIAKICLLVTTLAVLPSCTNLYLNPSKEKFVISLINSALAFFLFSFQVHEKSILLVAVPVLLQFHNDPLPCFWFLLISHFSMLPLFIKDNLFLAYVATILFYFFFVSCVCSDVFHSNELSNEKDVKLRANTATRLSKQGSIQKRKPSSIKIQTSLQKNSKGKYFIGLLDCGQNVFVHALFPISIFGVIILSVASNFLKPPEKYPDLFALFVSLYSCGHFTLFFLYFNYKQFCVSNNAVNKSKIQ